MTADETGTTDTPADGVETPPAGEQSKPDADVPPEVARALRKANKEAQDLRIRLKEFEDRDKSEADKLAERAAAAERKAQELESRMLRVEVAAAKGLTLTQAKRLIGSTREELEADADELLADIKPGRPKPDDGQGQAPSKPNHAADGKAEARRRFGATAGQQ